MTTCTWCGTELDAEESDSPRTDGGGDVICDNCHHDHYEFTCCLCEDYGDVEVQHKYLVVFTETDGVLPGIYQTAEDRPYWCDAVLDAWLYPEALSRVRDLTPGLEASDRGWPCGHLCGDCQDKLIEDNCG